MNAKYLDNETRKGITKKRKLSEDEESTDEFPVVEIQRKTIEEERNWIKDTFNELRSRKTAGDGESLRGTTVEAISSSIPYSYEVVTSCNLKLTNLLDSALTDPQYHLFVSSKNGGPTRIEGHQSEVISFLGGYWSGYCSILCSFAISRLLRLTIRCSSFDNADILFGIGFTPADVPTDESLDDVFNAMPPVPDVWMIKERSKVPLELFVTHGSLLVRGHMSLGPRSIVHVEILDMNTKKISSLSGNEVNKTTVDTTVQSSLQHSGTISSLVPNSGRLICNIEIVNSLSLTLRNRGSFYCKCKKNNFLPPEVLPFGRETFFGEDEAEVKAMFCYEIDSTDFAIVVALKVGLGLNSFAAAFVQNQGVGAGEKELEALMDQNQWRTHDYRKYATASEGVQLIRIGNIRGQVRMTEGSQSVLKIRCYAF